MPESPKTLTYTETAKLLDALKNGHQTAVQKAKCYRNYTLALLMLDAGLRVGEAVQLTCDHLWQQGKACDVLHIDQMTAKKGACRDVPASARLKSAIEDLFRFFWNFYCIRSDGYAFPVGKKSHHITTRQVERILGDASRLAIGRAIWPHQLRHTFASRLMRLTNARVVQELLGHKQLTSTQIYTHPNGDDLAQAIAGLPS